MSRANCRAKIETPPRSLDEDDLPRNDVGVFRESVPCRHRSAWQRRKVD
jgi:hypothetical protein